MIHNTTKIIALTGLTFLLVSVGAFVLFLRAVQLHKDQYTEQTTELARLEARRVSISALMRMLDETKVERSSLVSRMLKEEDVINFLALVESLGQEQGVALRTSSLTVEPINSTFETLIVGVSVEGSYEGVMQVMKILESLPYQSSIVNVQITRGGGESASTWKSEYKVQVTKFKKT